MNLSFAIESANFAKLDKTIQGKKILGIGEQVNGSAGFYEVRTELMKYLITTHGFRGILVESPTGFALPATAYIETCRGSAVAAMRSLFFASYFDSRC